MYNLFFLLARKAGLGFILLLIHPKSALNTSGWFKSFRKSSVIDNDNNIIPWWTYSFIDFIKVKINKEHRVLEFGCGNSTIWLSKRVKEVVAIEDYENWAIEITKKISSNSKIINVKSISEYEEYNYLIEGEFDVLIIDNLGNRINCAIQNIHHLNDKGIVIWDNTDGTDWSEIKMLMQERGFREISFSGMVPQELNMSKTTLFYRENNCLDI